MEKTNNDLLTKMERMELNSKKSYQLLSKGLGKNFESFNAVWIEKFLKLDYPDIKIETNQFFKDDQYIVNDKTNKFHDFFFQS